jgi:CheY-like chemotaxis protein
MVTILIADDSADNRDILSEVLGEEGYDIIVSTNASDTLDIAVAQSPDLILMDLQMPDGPGSTRLNDEAGLDATRALKTNPVTTGIPIVALSGYDAGSTSRAIASAGCNATATKPYDFAVLLDLISQFVETP